MGKHKVKVISDAEVALFLGRKPRKGRKKYGKEESAQFLLEQFTAENIVSALKDKRGKKIDLVWIVRKLLDIYASEDTKSSDRLGVLDRLKELILLGAIQDKELVVEVNSVVKGDERGGETTDDPFTTGKLKVVGK